MHQGPGDREFCLLLALFVRSEETFYRHSLSRLPPTFCWPDLDHKLIPEPMIGKGLGQGIWSRTDVGELNTQLSSV